MRRPAYPRRPGSSAGLPLAPAQLWSRPRPKERAHVHPIPALIAAEIGATPAQVSAAVELLDGGATVPFVARYRKEVTGGLDDTQLRKLEERLGYLRELEARRAAILTDHRARAR
jgi:uncharacterized protein